MPNMDKTGPRGKGPRTGRGMGTCDTVGNIVQPGRGQNRPPRFGLGRMLRTFKKPPEISK